MKKGGGGEEKEEARKEGKGKGRGKGRRWERRSTDQPEKWASRDASSQ
jgi:hypothetical protein